VVDAGAFIGDHTVTYAKLVGSNGRVYAFEPNPDAFDCLQYNTAGLLHVFCENAALGASCGGVSIVKNQNAGASHLTVGGFIQGLTLDYYLPDTARLDFIKIDVEGFEVALLNGAKETIRRRRPAMFIEVNAGALQRACTSREALFAIIGELGYDFKIVPATETITSPQYDILCTYRK
jgi:FkbM family methyltransferase